MQFLLSKLHQGIRSDPEPGPLGDAFATHSQYLELAGIDFTIARSSEAAGMHEHDAAYDAYLTGVVFAAIVLQFQAARAAPAASESGTDLAANSISSSSSSAAGHNEQRESHLEIPNVHSIARTELAQLANTIYLFQSEQHIRTLDPILVDRTLDPQSQPGVFHVHLTARMTAGALKDALVATMVASAEQESASSAIPMNSAPLPQFMFYWRSSQSLFLQLRSGSPATAPKSAASDASSSASARFVPAPLLTRGECVPFLRAVHRAHSSLGANVPFVLSSLAEHEDRLANEQRLLARLFDPTLEAPAHAAATATRQFPVTLSEFVSSPFFLAYLEQHKSNRGRSVLNLPVDLAYDSVFAAAAAASQSPLSAALCGDVFGVAGSEADSEASASSPTKKRKFDAGDVSEE